MPVPSDTPPSEIDSSEDELETKPFLDHLEDLRWMFLKSLAALFVTTSVAFYGLPVIMEALEWPLRGLAEVVEEAQTFRSKDIRDSAALAARLKSAADPVSQYLVGRFSEGTKKQLQESVPSQPLPEKLREELLVELNRVLQGESIYDAARFASIHLPDQSRDWIEKKVTGKNLIRLNRSLIDESYPQEIYRSSGPLEFDPHKFLNTIGPGEVFIFSIKLALYSGVLFALPLILYFIGGFILPALTSREKRYLWPAFAMGGGLFMVGAAFCFFYVMPKALSVSVGWARWMGVDVTFWRVGEYVTFVTGFMLGMGMAFETPVVLLTLVKMGILSHSGLKKGRRYWFVFSLVAGALLTTPEVFTQVVMAAVLCALYELSIWGAWLIERRERLQSAQS